MKLDLRKLKILTAIVETYIDTGEPVSSKMLAQKLDINVSPATIRNDMAALFDMGFLEQPHTSAGRVPSHLGYRIYVDQLMHCKPLSDEERGEIDALFNVCLLYTSRTRGVTINPDGSTAQEMTAEQEQWFNDHWLLQYDQMFGSDYLNQPAKQT